MQTYPFSREARSQKSEVRGQTLRPPLSALRPLTPALCLLTSAFCLLTSAPAAHAAGSLWFNVTVCTQDNGDANVPRVTLQNLSRTERITDFVITCGNLDAGFDALDPGNWSYPAGVTVTSTPVTGTRPQKIVLNFNPGLLPGQSFSMYVDVDCAGGDCGLDFRTQFFNNGAAVPNSEVSATNRVTGASAAFTMTDTTTRTEACYSFDNQPPARTVRVQSVAEAAGGNERYVSRTTAKLFNGVDPIATYTDIGAIVDIPAYEGETVEVTAPQLVYKDIHSRYISDSVLNATELQNVAEERFSAAGISVNDVPPTGDPTYYRFTVTNDTYIVVKWDHDYALTILNDFNLTQSVERDTSGAPWAGPLTSQGTGNADPAVQKHWKRRGETVIAQIDGAYEDQSRPGLKLRHVPKSYRAYGPANRYENADHWNVLRANSPLDVRTTPDTVLVFPFDVGQVPPQRQQVREFTMYGPAGITYVWQIQYGVQVHVDSPARASLAKVFRATDTGDVEVGALEGTFWFDPGTALKVGTAANATDANSTALTGWMGGDGYYFGASGKIDSSTGDLTEGFPSVRTDGSPVAQWVNQFFDPANLKPFRGLFIPDLQRPANVQWIYGPQSFNVNVALGEYVFQHDAAHAAVFTNQPDTIVRETVSGRNTAVADSDMAIWDPAAAKLYPLVPGTFKATWRADPSGVATVEVHVTATNPNPSHYRHILGTPPVALDPDPTDNFIFKTLKYTENGAVADGQKKFTATTEGHSVLLFAEIQRAGRAAPAEFLRVRVVESKLYQNALAPDATNVIGRKITDAALDKANLGTGFILFTNARFNPFIYDAAKLDGLAAKDIYDLAALHSDTRSKNVIHKDRLPGPIIPVNLHPNLNPNAGEQRIVVVWYDDPSLTDGLMWPAYVRRYLPRWPTTSQEGLGRIVIASQDGSDGQDAGGNDQEVVPALGIAPRETTYNPTRVNQVQVYSQPNPDRPGYNPNEEHGLIVPSRRFNDVSPIPPAVYALRNNDLNTCNRNSSGENLQPAGYTSHPFVLVQFFDTAADEFKMRVYSVQDEDSLRHAYQFASQSVVTTNLTTNGITIASATPLELRAQTHLTMEAGEPVIPFYPLIHVIGASPCADSLGINLKGQATYWRDHKGTFWSVSGGTNAWFTLQTYYPLAPDFYWPLGKPGFFREVLNGQTVERRATVPQAGDCVAFVPTGITNLLNRTAEEVVDVTSAVHALIDPKKVLYKSEWPANAPILKAGETLTFNGGEYRADHPTHPIVNDDGEIETAETPGLPQVVAFASAEVAFDSLNPFARTAEWKSNWTARVAQVLDKREVPMKLVDFPPDLAPATKRTRVKGGKYIFAELPASLQKRVRYDPLLFKLQMYGRLNEKEIGDDSLTAAPPAVYVLEPNVLTEADHAALLKLSTNQKWIDAVDQLVILSRNPGLVDSDNAGIPSPDAEDYRAKLETFWKNYYTTVGALPAGGVVPLPVAITNIDAEYLVGLEPKVLREENGTPVTVEDPAVPGLRRTVSDVRQSAPVRAFGPGLAVIPNADFLNPTSNLPEISWVTVAENNDPSLGGSPVTLHVIQVSRKDRYRGSIKTIESDNVFDENLVLRHTGDFGANADSLFFEWWYRPDDGSLNVPPPDLIPAGQTNPWKLFPDPTGKRGQGRYEVLMKGNPNAPETLLADSFWFVRYRHAADVTQGTDWKQPQPPQPGGLSAVPFVWAGAGNSQPFVDLDGDGFMDYRAQLASGWIKRVLDRVNPYEARINDFEGDNPATRSSMIAQFGPRFEGPVALNPDKNVIENVGLIELYETILKRGRDLSIDLSQPLTTPAVANALQLASTRIADFYSILGNEAYTDALDPTIGFGSEPGNDLSGANPGYGSMAPAVFCFQNQAASLIDEELGLLRGVDEYYARPVYNRFFWNFMQGEGTAAYAVNYNLQDMNLDGFINEDDAMILYPQGHGDAWGHYLTALRNQYELLRHPYFNWVSRSEFYNLQDIVIKVDFLDERKFAQAAAAKAKVGAEVVNLTYRQKYVEQPDAQWQGYTDSNKDRSWGVDEWARRAGQGAFFDWVTANALLPAVHPNPTLEGIQKVDRTVNSDIQVVSANLNAIQRTIDEANKGQNPLGIARDALVFDIDSTFLEVGSTAQIGTRAVQGLQHYDQIYERALKMIQNTVAVWNNANDARNHLRSVGNSELEFRNSTFQEDLSYKNQLIKIFGKPYEGTIGPGKIYPAGYDGPDLLTFMYVDVREINYKTVPGPTADFGVFTETNLTSGQMFDAYVKGTGSVDGGITTIDAGLRTLFSPSFVGGAGSASALLRDGLYGVQYTDLVNPKVNMTNFVQSLPVTTAGYSFQAPRDWGQRRAVGELQLQLGRMLQQEAAVAEAVGAWDSLQGGIVRQIRLLNAKVQTSDDIRERNEAFIRTKYIITGLIQGFQGIRAAMKVADGTFDIVGGAAITAIPRNLPTAGLSVSPGDALSAGAAGIRLAFVPGKAAFLSIDGFAEFAKVAAEIGLNIAENEVALANDAQERLGAKKELLVGLENLVGDEPIRRITIFKEIQALREMSDEYRGMVDEGSRLIDERAAFNKRVAAQTQRNRYQDMTFRVSRNYALQTYRSAFDLAAKYAYLAAKAYDYETNFDPSDPGSPVNIFADIMRARTLGQFADGEPRMGAGGLCEALARMKENYEVLKGQLGINNPQIEIGKASLRTENFRILPSNGGTEVTSVDYLTNTTANATTITTVYTLPNGSSQQPTNGIYGFPAAGADSDELWKQTLRDAVVPDLWAVTEFRQYCRPFAAEADANGNHVKEPGIVLRFSTQIHAGHNMFGKPLTGGDHAFDPTHYASKIQSAGVWFSDYLSADPLNDLPATPRVYLVPVGSDIMSIPTSSNPDRVRIWKVLDQSIPVPIPATAANLNSTTYIPVLDGLNGQLGQARKYSTFRAYHNGSSEVDLDELVADTRLVARSVWNTQWMLVIPGRLLNYDPNVGLDRFIEQVTDVKLVFRTYGLSGN